MAWTYAKRTHSGVRHMGMYRYPAGRKRSAGTSTTQKPAAAAAASAEGKVADGTWLDQSAGRIRFEEYVTTRGWPSLHVEVSTKVGYRSYLDRHFITDFGHMPRGRHPPSHVRAWVNKAVADGLAAPTVLPVRAECGSTGCGPATPAEVPPLW